MASSKSEYRVIKNKIYSLRNPVKGVATFFSSYSLSTIKKYAPLLCQENFCRKAFTGNLFPIEPAQLESCGNTPFFYDIEQTLIWYALGLEVCAKHINYFLSLRSTFDHAFLLADYETCFQLLDKCHEQFGWSLWEIKKRILLYSERDGIDAQKKYTSEVVAGLEKNQALHYLILSYSKQCERTMSFSAYINAIHTDISRFLAANSSPAICQYVQYKTNGYDEYNSDERISCLTEKTLNYFLFQDGKLSFIDRYLSFCTMLCDIFSLGNQSLQQLFAPYLQSLNHTISDPLLKNIAHFQEEGYLPFSFDENCAKICHAFDCYNKGDYSTSLAATSSLIQEDKPYFSLAELYAKSCAHFDSYITVREQESKCLLDAILLKLRKLFIQQDNLTELHFDLYKLLYLSWDTTWARQLLVIIDRHDRDLFASAQTSIPDWWSGVSLPSDLFNIPSQYIDAYMLCAPDTFCNSISVKLAIAVSKGDYATLNGLPIDNARKQIRQANMLINSSPAKAIPMLLNLLNHPGATPMLPKVNAMLVRAYLCNECLVEAMDIFVTAFYQNSNFVYFGHVDQIFDVLKTGEYDVQSSILAPIICSIYFNCYPQCDHRDDIVWTQCYEEYLTSRGVRRPSELLCQLEPENVDANTIRYLADVCVPSIMERSTVFESSDEVLQERIAICDALVQFAPESSKKFIDEIHRLTKTSLIQLARREVECGKIYVDMEGIRTILMREVSESYERYIDFKSNNLTDLVLQVLSASKSTSPIVVIEPVKQSDMLYNILKHIRDIFVADNKYGLDGCLSVRIRHGTLESQLRSCFKKHNLVTNKTIDGSYKKNTFWLGDPHDDSFDSTQIDAVFSNFSSEVDRIITHLKKDLIQIKTEDKQNDGLFDFAIDPQLVAVFESRAYPEMLFDVFSDMMLEVMLHYTNSGLERVRNILNQEINTSFQDALKALESGIKKCKTKNLNLSGLSDQIAKTRTDISTELKSISEWFRLAQPESFPDFQLSVALSISIEKIRASNPGALICDPENIGDNITLTGKTLPYFVDIFNILLDNVVKHSGLSKNVETKINVSRAGNQIVMQIENATKPGIVDPHHLQEVRAELAEWEQRDYVKKEGGSGLHKVKKILSVDLHCKNDFSFSCENNIFSVRIEAELGGAIL